MSNERYVSSVGGGVVIDEKPVGTVSQAAHDDMATAPRETWSPEGLIATGCSTCASTEVKPVDTSELDAAPDQAAR